MLETSELIKENVRALQRKLYLKAKHQPTFRFYSLYDKVYRSDVLQYAYDRVRANKGNPGIDGETFDSIETGIGRTAYLQEIQKTLKDKTYRAMDDIKESLLKGHIQVIDADLSKYFDTIPHDKLQKTVAERIVDSQLLSLLKQWLKVRIIKVEKGKEIVVGGGKKARKGTPQGGVISPRLANIYLNILDRIWERHRLAEKYKAQLIRYADDRVILCARDTTHPYSILQTVLNKLELTLNEEKTQIRDARHEKFGFLGFSIGIAQGKQSGKYFPLVEPSDKAIKSVKQKIKFYTRRDMNPVPIEAIVGKLNQTVRGWSNYFH